MSKYLSYNGWCNTRLMEKLVPNNLHAHASFTDNDTVKISVAGATQAQTKELPIASYLSDALIDRDIERTVSECLTELLECTPAGTSENSGNTNCNKSLPKFIDVDNKTVDWQAYGRSVPLWANLSCYTNSEEVSFRTSLQGKGVKNATLLWDYLSFVDDPEKVVDDLITNMLDKAAKHLNVEGTTNNG